MLQQRPGRQAEAAGAGAAYEARHRRKMLLALALVLAALVVVLAKNNNLLSGNDETADSQDTTTAWVPRTFQQPAPTPVPAATPAVEKHVTAPRVSAAKSEPKSQEPSAVVIHRSAVPPLEIEVVAGGKKGSGRANNNTLKIEMPANTESTVAGTSNQWGPATSAAEQMRTYSAPERVPQPTNVSYPLLAQQMKVQGAVLLQAIIGADGVIRDLRVLSGPAILASAAREAALQWKFKPYLQNGNPVETTARITVNFTIKVLDNVIKDQPAPVVALSRAGNS